MSKEDSEFTHSLDEEIKATKHDQESNDQSQEVSLLGKSFSHVGQVFMPQSLTASPQTYLKEKIAMTKHHRAHRSSNTGTFSADIRDHNTGLTAEQRFKTIVENAKTLEEICEGLTFSLPLAQMTNALQWKKNLVKFYPMLKGWEIQTEIPTFGGILYIPGLKNVKDMKIKEVEVKLEEAEDDLTKKIARAHQRWTLIPSQDQALKVVSLSAAKLG